MTNKTIALKEAFNTINAEVIHSLARSETGVAFRLKYALGWLTLAIQNLEAQEKNGSEPDDSIQRESLHERATKPMIYNALSLSLSLDKPKNDCCSLMVIPKKVLTSKERILLYHQNKKKYDHIQISQPIYESNNSEESPYNTD